ncbi:UDP-N-acetylmuramoyl-L-alanine--D-glutamate ligase [Candidatus Synechococcus calcipolaris G9]|uniref:UDP-N-acetylmuramoylalanine--D-glutamate ligase n=1 Tax=Candidatus Synechococcus calcipolaris G9 TaxID=1497997 RepID=A0ABT6EZF0_9SYNE|nr:UDP-N-acetylmuramoyl-L-alanine--D-glutamate ligase [Candidatus Synechococcus calcipolaris]MDG2990945.1 UDP-N-acetylmuramoyl-L-alanine--D-glutamate ligase [Candidatus Synechococcus calcipolaris G9]
MPTAHVIGLGCSGIAAARLLQQKGWQVTLSDRTEKQHFETLKNQLEHQGIGVYLGWNFSLQTLEQQNLTQPDVIVISPGVPWHSPNLEAARQSGISVIGEVEIAWQHLQSIPWVSITGTNGKTTTTALTAAIFQAAGFQAPACGNIGYSLCEVALTQQPDWVIAEISSYQLESRPSLHSRCALWTTLTPDHLERHGTLEQYSATKAQLLEQADIPILNGDDPYLRTHMNNRWPGAWWVSCQGSAALPQGQKQAVYLEDGWIFAEQTKLIPISLLKMPGIHNQQNLLLAVAAAYLADIPVGAIAEGIAQFPGVPHRLEWICHWQDADWINDSKATNYDAAEIGLRAVPGPVILIAGGQAKIGEDRAWLKTIQEKAANVLLIGAAADDFAQRLGAIGYENYQQVETLENAVRTAAGLVAQSSVKTVLFSPACASFDQYQNFESRGNHFRKLCLEL